MTIEELLMRNLKHTHASARRRHTTEDGQKKRGYGHILDLLPENSGLSQQQIADSLMIRPQSVSEALSTLEADGYIRKEASSSDKRITLIYITEQGCIQRETLRQMRKEHAIEYFSVLTEEEKEQLLQLLEKLNHQEVL